MLVLTNCRFIDFLTEDTDLENGDIIIKEGIIESIVPCGTKIDGEYQTIDLAGQTLLPGFIDMHVHLFMTSNDYYTLEKTPPTSRAFECYNYAKNLLNYGYTTVRDVGDDTHAPTVALRNAIEAGIIDGPRVSPSAGTLCPREAGVEVLEYIIDYVNGATDMRQKVRSHFQNGVDFIKLYGSGSMMAVGSEPGLRILEEDEIKEAVKMAKRKQSYVAIHAHGAEAIDTAVKCGVRTVEHASLISNDTVQYMKQLGEEVGLVPTMAAFSELVEGDQTDFFSKRANRLLKTIIASLSNAYQNGLLIGWGTDISLPAFLEDPFVEFKFRSEQLKYSNEDILKQLTINSAKLMKKEQEIGTIKEGKLADLIVIEGDPVKDIHAMYQTPSHIIKDGKVVR